jgi:hypothetical protein
MMNVLAAHGRQLRSLEATYLIEAVAAAAGGYTMAGGRKFTMSFHRDLRQWPHKFESYLATTTETAVAKNLLQEIFEAAWEDQLRQARHLLLQRLLLCLPSVQSSRRHQLQVLLHRMDAAE